MSQEGGLHIDKICRTLDKPMASLSICHLAFALDGDLVKYLEPSTWEKHKTTLVSVVRYFHNISHMSPESKIIILTPSESQDIYYLFCV